MTTPHNLVAVFITLAKRRQAFADSKLQLERFIISKLVMKGALSMHVSSYSTISLVRKFLEKLTICKLR